MALTLHAALAKDTRDKDVKLQHRHFKFIAATLRDVSLSEKDETPLDYSTWRAICVSFSDACAATNPKFDRARFLKACGYYD